MTKNIRKKKKSVSYKIKKEKTVMVSLKEQPHLDTGKKRQYNRDKREKLAPSPEYLTLIEIKKLPSISLSVHLTVKIKDVCSSWVSI